MLRARSLPYFATFDRVLVFIRLGRLVATSAGRTMPQLDQRHWLLGGRLQQMGFLLQQRFPQPVKGREKASRESPSREAACEDALFGSAHQFQRPINFRLPRRIQLESLRQVGGLRLGDLKRFIFNASRANETDSYDDWFRLPAIRFDDLLAKLK